MKRIVQVVFFFLLAPMAFAFNGSRCARLYDTPNYIGKAERATLKMFLATTSTGQYFTSTGKCKMIGGISQSERVQFVADNSEQIKKNIIRADGDYLTAMAFLYGCDQGSYDHVALRLQESAEVLLGSNFDNDSKNISHKLDQFMKTDPRIGTLCSQKQII